MYDYFARPPNCAASDRMLHHSPRTFDPSRNTTYSRVLRASMVEDVMAAPKC
jgi:hypothetical protein